MNVNVVLLKMMNYLLRLALLVFDETWFLLQTFPHLLPPVQRIK